MTHVIYRGWYIIRHMYKKNVNKFLEQDNSSYILNKPLYLLGKIVQKKSQHKIHVWLAKGILI
jgi:hypothetical protein